MYLVGLHTKLDLTSNIKMDGYSGKIQFLKSLLQYEFFTN